MNHYKETIRTIQKLERKGIESGREKLMDRWRRPCHLKLLQDKCWDKFSLDPINQDPIIREFSLFQDTLENALKIKIFNTRITTIVTKVQ